MGADLGDASRESIHHAGGIEIRLKVCASRVVWLISRKEKPGRCLKRSGLRPETSIATAARMIYCDTIAERGTATVAGRSTCHQPFS
jgi:hypothetical protein